jgi:hypothetical protein
MLTNLVTCVSGVTCCGWAFWQQFDCPMCERTVCYCNGCHDDAPALCDDCWYRVSMAEAPAEAVRGKEPAR